MNLDRYISETGVTVVTGKLPVGCWGLYDWERHRIVLTPRLGAVQYPSTLAHELGHAWFRHRGTTPRQEREASIWAARQLIDASAFIDALRVCESQSGVAQILGVMPSDIDTYISCLTATEVSFIRSMIRREEAA